MLQLIARPLLMRSNLPTSTWGYAILHVGLLVRLRPSSLESITPTDSVHEQVPSIKHLRVFGCKVLVPIPPPPQHGIKMGPQRKEMIYVGCESPSIIRYLDLPTRNLLRGRFTDWFFDEEKFQYLVGQSNPCRDLSFNDLSILNMFLDPRTKKCERGVEHTLHLNQLANRPPDSFNNTTNVTKSHIHNVSTPTHLGRPAVQTTPIKNGRDKNLQHVRDMTFGKKF